MSGGHTKFHNALLHLRSENVLDNVIFISAASLRVLGIRVYTYFIDLLVTNSYYQAQCEKTAFTPRYELEPLRTTIAGFSLRLGTVKDNACSFQHLVEPYNIYTPVDYSLDNQTVHIKIRPHDYVRKDSQEAIERMINRYDKGYWQDFYSYHQQIEAIDLGRRQSQLQFGSEAFLDLET